MSSESSSLVTCNMPVPTGIATIVDGDVEVYVEVIINHTEAALLKVLLHTKL